MFIIFISDNGLVWWFIDIEFYGYRLILIYWGMKFDVWEGGYRMLFIVSWFGVIEEGLESVRIVLNIDMLVIFLDLFGELLLEEVGVDSYSFLDVLYRRNGIKFVREVIVGRLDNIEFYIRKGDWKFIGVI